LVLINKSLKNSIGNWLISDQKGATSLLENRTLRALFLNGYYGLVVNEWGLNQHMDPYDDHGIVCNTNDSFIKQSCTDACDANYIYKVAGKMYPIRWAGNVL
jgi:hypothetical protein